MVQAGIGGYAALMQIKKPAAPCPAMMLGVLVLAAVSCSATAGSIGIFDGHSDVGAVKHPGTASYDAKTQEYSMSGSGANMWGDTDEFHYLWKRMTGDFILTARMHLLGTAVEPHRKIGWTVRPSLDTHSAHVVAVTHGSGLTDLQYRPAAGAITVEQTSVIQGADVLQLERRGSTYIMSVARFGEPFTVEKSVDVSLGDAVYVGLFVCAHNPDLTEKAVFTDVRITVPAKADFVPYKDYIGSDLEILDVATGGRRLIYHSADSLQAPNWTRDGKSLIYNSKGRLYRFDLAARKAALINTDFAVNNNNDHVLSFDGKMLGISHQGENNISRVYTLPAAGGKPKEITLLGPSYLHSWSPDAKFLVYTGGRNGNFDIYKIPSGGGREIRLTDAPSLEDGPEYTPDGNTIYFNSTSGGLMQLWRMNPDGSNKERVTHSDTNDWFAHISPDGKQIVYLSFLNDIKPEEHPFYRQVYIRLMPIGGEPAKVIAYVYGGQGTINTPSWSPDSRRVAFVSNSDAH
jgi:TolB protein